MIPKIIHYCWFGGNPLPELAQKCIASWKKYCPDYEIKEWNESNFDLNCCDYVREAYEAKKWAFVSDYARFLILYHEGGIYFDTDVEIIKSLDKILEQGAFLGCEKNEGVTSGMAANPGLGIASDSGLNIYKEMLEFYKKRHFKNADGSIDTTTIVTYTTQILKLHGWNPDAGIQKIEGITVYPPEYFCPMSNETGKLIITPNTYTIHHYSASWFTEKEKKIIQIRRKFSSVLGNTVGDKLALFFCIPLRLANKIEVNGKQMAVKSIASRVKRR